MVTLRRVIRIPMVWFIAGALATAVSPVLSVVASVKYVEYRADRQAAANRKTNCQFIDIWLRTFDETPIEGTGVARRNLQAQLLTAYKTLKCQPPR